MTSTVLLVIAGFLGFFLGMGWNEILGHQANWNEGYRVGLEKGRRGE